MRYFIKRLTPQALRYYAASCARAWNAKNTDLIAYNYLGHRFRLSVTDSHTRGWYGRDWYPRERQELLFLQGLGIKADGLILNIGAHQGLVSMLLKRMLAPEGRVIAVEMDQLNARACAKNFALNSESEITAVHAAVSDRSGTIRSTGSSIASSQSLLNVLYERVRAVTLDEICLEYGSPELVYIDVEGAEVLALRGAENALASVPVWFVELHGDQICGQFGGSNHEVARTFRNLGFQIYRSLAEDDPFVPCHDATVISGDRCFIIAISPKHTHNS
ncbi:MAG: FkbM family methyltransferase [Methyloceanibacter sp.]